MSTQLTPSMRRSALIAALRDPKLRPAGFEWDFAAPHRCAMGVYAAIFNSGDWVCTWDLNAQLAITELDRQRLFNPTTSDGYGVPSYNEITPSMVADKLERLHKELMEQGK